VGIVFRLEHIGSTDLTATTILGTDLGQVSLLFIFREEPRTFLRYENGKSEKKQTNVEKTSVPGD
jgi:hypothetical protein